MNPGYELALPIGALAFYLWDAAVLLHDNEMLFVRRQGRWLASAGGDVVLAGRRLCFPALLMPWCPVMRGVWSMSTDVGPDPPEPLPPGFRRALRPLQVAGTLMLAIVAVALPVAALLLDSALVLLAVFASGYLVSLGTIAWVVARRDTLGVRGRESWLLALDVIACPPFGIGVVRRLTLRRRMHGDALAFIDAHLVDAHRAHALGLIRGRVDAQVAAAAPGSAGIQLVLAYRARLSAHR